MLSFSDRPERNCEGLRRRQFLQIGALGGLGVSLPLWLAQKNAQAAGAGTAKDVNCIVIWTQGGTSHHDTFDPKPQAPQAVRGEFQTIQTALPGEYFTEIVPRMARELPRYGLLRGWNPMNGSHGTADAWVLSGKRFNPAMIYPTYGSVVSYEKGFRTALPPYVQLGTSIDRRFGGGAPGYLGLKHAAFEIQSDPNAAGFTVRDISLPTGVDVRRTDHRQAMLKQIDALQRRGERQPELFAAQDQHYQAAVDIITSRAAKEAFALESEDPRLRDRYGRTKLGQNLLLARRLIEGGVRFVTVTDGGWDTHQNNFASLRDRLIPPVDLALPELLIDLEERGLLANTLVCWFTDFGRTPKINSASGRDHWSTAGFAVMAGAGVPGGSVLGRTDDEGGAPTRDEYRSEDLAATIFTKLGIPLETIHVAPDGRPVRLNEGRPIREWM